MRLTQIKLAGFKSFVDPTTVDLKSNLVAVVGPNGSGKSNIIDAVRWVMGESSAKYLRGESMADVIFNGSSGRKPSAHASIELIFDNTESRLGGQYASYQTISVKREVTRDGQSNYYFNGSRCRRRDIKDIFLGTGLGPRSYAIILQDTISRLIEAKPEEFRGYIEEVAGIAKYKERRHETGLRIKHTRENLERVSDLRGELEKQMNHLDRQAKAAERYKVLKQEERLTKAQLHALQWQVLRQQSQTQQQSIGDLQTRLDTVSADVRQIDTEFERLQDAHLSATEAVDKTQSDYYGLGAETSRLEQAQKHQRERKQQIQEDFKLAQDHSEKARLQLREDETKLEELGSQAEALKPALEQKQQALGVSTEALTAAERTLNHWQQRWEAFNETSVQAERQAEVEKTRIQQLELRHQELNHQIETLQQEQTHFDFHQAEAVVTRLQNQVLEHSQTQEKLQNQLDELQKSIQMKREQLQKLSQKSQHEAGILQQLRGKHASLEALQQAALGQKDNQAVSWLQKNQLHQQPRIAEILEVSPGWETAVETVLDKYLEAVCIEDLSKLADFLQDLPAVNLSFVSRDPADAASFHPESLAAKVNAPDAIKLLLANVLSAQDFADARTRLPGLQPYESVITPDGLWLGQGWLRTLKKDRAQSGIIVRQTEINEIKRQIKHYERTLAHLANEQHQEKESLQATEQKREEQQRQLRETARTLAEAEAQLKVKRAEIQQQRNRVEALLQKMDKAKAQHETLAADLIQAKDKWRQALQHAQVYVETRQQMLAERDGVRSQLDAMRANVKQARDEAHELALRHESVSTQIAGLKQNVQRNQSHFQQLQERCERLRQSLDTMDQPLEALQAELAQALDKRRIAEQVLHEARQALAGIDQQIRHLSQQRQQKEAQAAELRQKLEQKRMYFENIKVRSATLAEQIQELSFNLETLIAEMPEDAHESAWQEKLASLERRIAKLGPINLAAIEEFKEISARKSALDAQVGDLEEALTTLENAIRKIDKETRQKFKETYDTVNQHFQTLFPRIFGGGHASLVLTGDDLLDTGVAIMARPPGKKNSTIHLLSGGEKALTAIALVFSLFQINPAPFCILDEVDAPLDDANVGRFCNLVKEMAEDLPFIFISHNKLAIEMANQLIGVTMREPGVSRLVAVDIDEAVAMAAEV